MGYRKRAGGGRRDASEPAILEAYDAVGAEYWLVGGTGNPDAIVRYRGIWTPVEHKTGKGKRTKNQTDVPWPVVNNPRSALIVIGVPYAVRAAHGFEVEQVVRFTPTAGAVARIVE